MISRTLGEISQGIADHGKQLNKQASLDISLLDVFLFVVLNPSLVPLLVGMNPELRYDRPKGIAYRQP